MNIDETAGRIHKTAVEHGFWPPEGRNLGEMLMLVNTELAECLEEDRAGMPLVYWKCKVCEEIFLAVGSVRDCCGQPLKPEGALVEVADAIIRLLDTGHEMASRTQYMISEVMDIKMDYNDSREHMHGKAY